MTRFFGHGQTILQVFETSIALSMLKSVKSQFFQTLLVPISWTLAICAGIWQVVVLRIPSGWCDVGGGWNVG